MQQLTTCAHLPFQGSRAKAQARENEGTAVEQPTAAVSTHCQEKVSLSLYNMLSFFLSSSFDLLIPRGTIGKCAPVQKESTGAEQTTRGYESSEEGQKPIGLETSLTALWLTSFSLDLKKKYGAFRLPPSAFHFNSVLSVSLLGQ